MRPSRALVMSILLLSAMGARSQNRTGFTVGVEKDFATGTFGSFFSKGFGAAAEALWKPGGQGALGLEIGWHHFQLMPAYNGGFGGHMNIVPVLAAYRLAFGAFYLEPEAGFGSYHLVYSTPTGETTQQNQVFTWAAKAGYRLQHLDLSLHYQSGNVPSDGYPTAFAGLSLAYHTGKP